MRARVCEVSRVRLCRGPVLGDGVEVQLGVIQATAWGTVFTNSSSLGPCQDEQSWLTQ